jgi:AcrR family transcriptional regulator
MAANAAIAHPRFISRVFIRARASNSLARTISRVADSCNRKLQKATKRYPRPARAALDGQRPPERETPRSLRQRAILRAVIEELARSDYGGLTFEKVAARAGVNKTTVYRHWDTKVDLVRTALSSVARSISPGPTTGTLRGDLLRIGRTMVDFATSFEGQCLMRLRLLQHPEPELAGVAKDLHARHVADLAVLAKAAVARGELAPDVDLGVMLDMLGGALHIRLVMKNEPVDDVLIAKIVDILLRGAHARPDPATAASSRRA